MFSADTVPVIFPKAIVCYPAKCNRTDEWDLLGWRKVTYPALRRPIKGGRDERLEVRWLNGKASATRPDLFAMKPTSYPANITEPRYSIKGGARAQ